MQRYRRDSVQLNAIEQVVPCLFILNGFVFNLLFASGFLFFFSCLCVSTWVFDVLGRR